MSDKISSDRNDVVQTIHCSGGKLYVPKHLIKFLNTFDFDFYILRVRTTLLLLLSDEEEKVNVKIEDDAEIIRCAKAMNLHADKFRHVIESMMKNIPNFGLYFMVYFAENNYFDMDKAIAHIDTYYDRQKIYNKEYDKFFNSDEFEKIFENYEHIIVCEKIHRAKIYKILDEGDWSFVYDINKRKMENLIDYAIHDYEMRTCVDYFVSIYKKEKNNPSIQDFILNTFNLNEKLFTIGQTGDVRCNCSNAVHSCHRCVSVETIIEWVEYKLKE